MCPSRRTLLRVELRQSAMVNCAVYDCSNRTRNSPNDENFKRVGFYIVPKVISGQCAKTTELSSKRRALWLSRIRREGPERIGGRTTAFGGAHFITGRPAYSMDEANLDCAPSLNLGYKSTTHAKRSASNSLPLKRRRCCHHEEFSPLVASTRPLEEFRRSLVTCAVRISDTARADSLLGVWRVRGPSKWRPRR
ncbi:hypothetical protein HPB52_018704 [Rhipicephalus sanguineus]|uniref:Uncharacterized protein n=1 Tax=Rhipicephalus sanguineus TaxID=34632 RepID=A0A9D4SUV6_RHISA|nr:hypothetical protein HPB52_018704 [Rhipicephalus sanguineus]